MKKIALFVTFILWIAAFNLAYADPKAKPNLVYTGAEQNVIEDGDGFQCSSDSTGVNPFECKDFKLKNAGTHKVYYSANPSATTPNWTAITGDVIIKPYEINVVWSNTELIYNGQNQIPSHSETLAEKETECTLRIKGQETNVGSHTAEVYFDNVATTCLGNYTFLTSSNKQSYTIKKKDVTITWKGPINFTYDGLDHAPEYDPKGQVSNDGCKLDYNSTNGKKTNANTSATSSYTATVDFDSQTCKDNYNIINPSKEFRIDQAVMPVVQKPTGINLTYNGLYQIMVNPGDCPVNGEMQYSTSQYGNYVNTFNDSSLNEVNVITKDIWYKCKSNDPNYRDSTPQSVTSKITPFLMQNFELKLKNAYYTPQNGTVYPVGANTTPDVNIDSVTGVGPRPGSSVIEFQNFTSDQNTIWKIDLNNSTWYEASSGVYRMYIDAINNYSGRTQADWLIGTAIVKLNGNIINPGTLDKTVIPNKYKDGVVYKNTPFTLVLDTDIRYDHTNKNTTVLVPAKYTWKMNNCKILNYEDEGRIAVSVKYGTAIQEK